MKGVSSIIAAILLLLIVIVIVAFAFGFFSQIVQQSTSTGEKEIANQQQQFSTLFQIEGVSGNKVYIRNVGSSPINELIFFVNGANITASGPASLATNELGTYTLDAAQYQSFPSSSVLKVSSIGWTTEMPVTPTAAGDTTPPEMSGGLPAGTLAAGTTQATLQMATNEAATCRYALSSMPYASMTNTFSTTGGIAHSTIVTGLSNGGSYAYYVRCIDAFNNPDITDLVISFNVAAGDTTPPDRYGGWPTGVLDAGTSSTTMFLNTDEAATCRYSTSAGTDYASMTNTFTGTDKVHTYFLNGLVSGNTYTQYVRCQDVAGNPNINDYPISFSIALSPPVISAINVSTVYSTTAMINWTTDRATNVTIKYGTSSGVYTSSKSDAAFVLTHSINLTGLSQSQAYYFVINATDASGISSVSTEQTFTTKAPQSAAQAKSGGTFISDKSNNGDNNWNNPQNAQMSENIYATTLVDIVNKNGYSAFLNITNFGFNIPIGATINGIQVLIERKTSSSAISSQDYAVYIIKNGVAGTANRATLTYYQTNDVQEPHGSTSDLWGTTWTASDINSNNFGVQYSAQSSLQIQTISVDWVQIMVYYTA